MDVYHTIIKPVVTEKSTHAAGHHSARRGGAYTFEVHPDANKAQIRDAVEKIYGVKVLDVRTQNRMGKLRRFRLRYGRTRATKKAVVVVAPNSAIELF
ncbi:MAG: 50S ribosomal protein L23 [Planctomycetota bacterium]|nr:MAG: 50S ribosomal protein L23 [Planctomycetota bacterium]